MTNRLKSAEQQNADYHAEISTIAGKLTAVTVQYHESQNLHEKSTRQNEKLQIEISSKSVEISKFKNLIEMEEESKLSTQTRLTDAQNTISKLTHKLDQIQLESDRESSRNAFNEQKISAQFNEKIEKLEKIIAEHEETISSTETELREILILNQKKEHQLTDQFKKIEDLITLNTKQGNFAKITLKS